MTNTTPSTPGMARSWSTSNGLFRSATNRRIKGVCGGISERYNIDASYVRIGFAVLTMVLMAKVSGLFIFSYLIAMILIGNRPGVGASPAVITFTPAATPAPSAPTTPPVYDSAPMPLPTPTSNTESPTAVESVMPTPTVPTPTVPTLTMPHTTTLDPEPTTTIAATVEATVISTPEPMPMEPAEFSVVDDKTGDTK